MTKASKARNERRQQANADDKAVVKVITIKDASAQALNFVGEVEMEVEGNQVTVFEKGKIVAVFNNFMAALITFKAE